MSGHCDGFVSAPKTEIQTDTDRLRKDAEPCAIPAWEGGSSIERTDPTVRLRDRSSPHSVCSGDGASRRLPRAIPSADVFRVLHRCVKSGWKPRTHHGGTEGHSQISQFLKKFFGFVSVLIFDT